MVFNITKQSLFAHLTNPESKLINVLSLFIFSQSQEVHQCGWKAYTQLQDQHVLDDLFNNRFSTSYQLRDKYTLMNISYTAMTMESVMFLL